MEVILSNKKIKKKKYIVLLGGGALAAEITKWAKGIGIKVLIITSPRHYEELVEEGIKLSELINSYSIPFLVIEKLEKDSILNFLNCDVDECFFLSLGAAWIFTDFHLTEIFNSSLYNLHGTRLPQNRGGGGMSWQILMGNRLGFSVLHKVEPGVDTGEIVRYEEFLYDHSCRKPMDFMNLYIKKNFLFIKSVIIELIDQGIEYSPIFQAEYFSSYWPRLNSEIHGWIDWSWEPLQIERFICAFDDPYCGAHALLNEKKIYLKSAMLNFQDGCFHPFQSGLVFRKAKNWIVVALNNASIIIESVTDEFGDNIIDQIKVGDRFYTTYLHLENKNERVFYTPVGLKKK